MRKQGKQQKETYMLLQFFNYGEVHCNEFHSVIMHRKNEFLKSLVLANTGLM